VIQLMGAFVEEVVDFGCCEIVVGCERCWGKEVRGVGVVKNMMRGVGGKKERQSVVSNEAA